MFVKRWWLICCLLFYLFCFVCLIKGTNVPNLGKICFLVSELFLSFLLSRTVARYCFRTKTNGWRPVLLRRGCCLAWLVCILSALVVCFECREFIRDLSWWYGFAGFGYSVRVFLENGLAMFVPTAVTVSVCSAWTAWLELAHDRAKRQIIQARSGNCLVVVANTGDGLDTAFLAATPLIVFLVSQLIVLCMNLVANIFWTGLRF